MTVFYDQDSDATQYDPAPVEGWWADPDFVLAHIEDLWAWDWEMVRYFGERDHRLLMAMLAHRLI